MHLKGASGWTHHTSPLSQERLSEGESAIPLGDTDAYGSGSAGPGRDTEKSKADLSFEYET